MYYFFNLLQLCNFYLFTLLFFYLDILYVLTCIVYLYGVCFLYEIINNNNNNTGGCNGNGRRIDRDICRSLFWIRM